MTGFAPCEIGDPRHINEKGTFCRCKGKAVELMGLRIDLINGTGYGIVIERGALRRASECFDLGRRVLIVTDSGVPKEYAAAIAAQSREPLVVCVPSGEKSKSLTIFEDICRRMLTAGFDRNDCVVAVGGGVVGDLAGFVASSYMRGIDFYNVPTTLLAQVDSSVGGKVAIDLDEVKNVVGAFKQPRQVLIDPDLLATLDPRQKRCGFAEAIKMALTSDAELFSIFERGEYESETDLVIYRALCVKRDIVQQDAEEHGVRKILNFGHTLGHGIECAAHGELLHGECVALGMLPMCGADVRRRLSEVYDAIGLPSLLPKNLDVDEAVRAVCHDKKMCGGDITLIEVEHPGECIMKNVTFNTEEMRDKILGIGGVASERSESK